MDARFWSSVDLTGNQTNQCLHNDSAQFWSSVDLAGNQTPRARTTPRSCFGAVLI